MKAQLKEISVPSVYDKKELEIYFEGKIGDLYEKLEIGKISFHEFRCGIESIFQDYDFEFSDGQPT